MVTKPITTAQMPKTMLVTVSEEEEEGVDQDEEVV